MAVPVLWGLSLRLKANNLDASHATERRARPSGTPKPAPRATVWLWQSLTATEVVADV